MLNKNVDSTSREFKKPSEYTHTLYSNTRRTAKSKNLEDYRKNQEFRLKRRKEILERRLVNVEEEAEKIRIDISKLQSKIAEFHGE